jgi:hypothetical protein
VLGVVVEVGMPKGVDLVAAWPDHHARYYNFSGAGVVWESEDTLVTTAIDRLLEVSEPVLRAIGPWEGKRPAAPTNGTARINLLSPIGLCFGEGPMDVLSKDRMGGPVLTAASQLMQILIQQTPK